MHHIHFSQRLVCLIVLLGLLSGCDQSGGDRAGQAPPQSLPTLLSFHAHWCGPCQRMKPVIDRLAARYRNRLEVIQVDIDQRPDLASLYEVRSIPCVVIVRDDEQVYRRTGATSQGELEQRIDSLIRIN